MSGRAHPAAAAAAVPAAPPNDAYAAPSWDAFVVRGEPVLYPERPAFRYADPQWYLPLPPESASEARTSKLTLGRLAAWLAPEAREWLADLWLRQGKNRGVIDQSLNAAACLGQALPSHVGTVGTLTRAEGRVVEAYLAAEHAAGRYGVWTVIDRRKYIHAFVRWARVHCPPTRAGDFELKHPAGVPTRASVEKPLGQDPEKFIEHAGLQQVLDACAEEELDYEWVLAERARQADPSAVNPVRAPAEPLQLGRVATYLSRAILAQVIKLAACVGRRAISVCLLPPSVRAEPGAREGMRGAWVRLRETKITGLEEDVFCYDVYGAVAVDAIAKARRYTEDLRRRRPDLGHRLFLLPGGSGADTTGPVALRPDHLNTYLRGSRDARTGGRARGLLARRGVSDGDSVAYITSHNFRTTLASKLFAGDMPAQDVAASLGHSPRSPDMAIKHYAVGSPEMRAMTERALKAGALSGDVIDLAAGRPVAVDRISPAMRAVLRERGIVYVPTVYGYCALPAEEGPCPTSNPCWLWPDPDHPKCKDGCGCPWEVKSPAAVAALEEDAAVLEAERDAHAVDPRYANWASHTAERHDRVLLHLAPARALQARLDASEAGAPPPAAGDA